MFNPAEDGRGAFVCPECQAAAPERNVQAHGRADVGRSAMYGIRGAVSMKTTVSILQHGSLSGYSDRTHPMRIHCVPCRGRLADISHRFSDVCLMGYIDQADRKIRSIFRLLLRAFCVTLLTVLRCTEVGQQKLHDTPGHALVLVYIGPLAADSRAISRCQLQRQCRGAPGRRAQYTSSCIRWQARAFLLGFMSLDLVPSAVVSYSNQMR